MSTYSLSGSGTHALTASTTGLQVTITTPSVIGGVGRSNPVAKYDQGLIRFSDGTSYWPPVAVLGGPQFIPVPANAVSMGYALLGGAVISVVEVIGGTVFFSGGASSVESLSDVLIASIADGQVIAWNAAAGKWENVTPASGGGLTLLASSELTASAASITFASIAGAYKALRLVFEQRTDAGATFAGIQFNGDTAADYDSSRFDANGVGTGVAQNLTQASGWYAYGPGSGSVAGMAAIGELFIPAYARTDLRKQYVSDTMDWEGGSDGLSTGVVQRHFAGGWRSTAAIIQIVLLPGAGNFTAGSTFYLWGMS